MWMWRKMTKDEVDREEDKEPINNGGGRGNILNGKHHEQKSYIRRHECLTNIFEGKVMGKRSRSRESYFKDVCATMDCRSYTEKKRKASEREEWQSHQGIGFRFG